MNIITRTPVGGGMNVSTTISSNNGGHPMDTGRGVHAAVKTALAHVV